MSIFNPNLFSGSSSNDGSIFSGGGNSSTLTKQQAESLFIAKSTRNLVVQGDQTTMGTEYSQNQTVYGNIQTGTLTSTGSVNLGASNSTNNINGAVNLTNLPLLATTITPTNSRQLITKGYVDSTLTSGVALLAGANNFTNATNNFAYPPTIEIQPTANTEIPNKLYVDSLVFSRTPSRTALYRDDTRIYQYNGGGLWYIQTIDLGSSVQNTSTTAASMFRRYMIIDYSNCVMGTNLTIPLRYCYTLSLGTAPVSGATLVAVNDNIHSSVTPITSIPTTTSFSSYGDGYLSIHVGSTAQMLFRANQSLSLIVNGTLSVVPRSFNFRRSMQDSQVTANFYGLQFSLDHVNKQVTVTWGCGAHYNSSIMYVGCVHAVNFQMTLYDTEAIIYNV